jgi:hypothetical protein
LAVDRSWQGVLITTRPTFPYLEDRSARCCLVMRLISLDREVVLVLWCRVAMARAKGSFSTSK